MVVYYYAEELYLTIACYHYHATAILNFLNAIIHSKYSDSNV